MRIISTADATATSDSLGFHSSLRDEWRPIHIQITGTATVDLQVRSAPDLGWVSLKTYDSTSVDKVSLFAELRVVVTGNTGQVDVEIDV